MKKTLKIIHKALLGIIILVMLFYNAKLFYEPAVEEGLNKDVYRQLVFLKNKMHKGAADEMQHYFPEGHLFMHALYSLSWIEEIKLLDQDHVVFKEGISEINWSVSAMKSDHGKAVFSKDLPLPYGTFYTGWVNYVEGKKWQLLKSLVQIDTTEAMHFRNRCDLILKAYKDQSKVYLESYGAGTWPADNLVAISSLAVYDKVFEPRYNTFIKEWVADVKEKMDPGTGLIPHSVSARTNKPLEGARGSSQSLMNIFLMEIDQDFGRQQYELYEKLFVDKRLGLPGIREYPKGKAGNGDVDSGPVIWDIGGAASIVGIRTAGEYGNWALHTGLRNSVEAFGMPFTLNGQKKYLAGKLPMADAFIAWSNSVVNKPHYKKESKGWRWQFQLWTGIVSLICLLVIIKW